MKDAMKDFIPNWTKKYPSKEAAIAGIIHRLESDKARLLKKSPTGEVVFFIGDYRIVLS